MRPERAKPRRMADMAASRTETSTADRLEGGAKRISPAPAVASLLTSPRVVLGCWPTPIQRVDCFGPPTILVKRDDLSGHGRGGAKARKIEGLLGYVRARGYDEIVTIAGNITNLAFDLVPALDRNGIRGTILIVDEPRVPPGDRAEIFRGIENRVRLVGHSRALLAAHALRTTARARREGRRPLLTLPGLSHPAAVAGCARGFIEMAEQLRARGDELPAAVFVTAATGTTLAGFLLGEAALRRAGGPPIPVVGVQVYPGRVGVWTRALIRWTEHALGLEARVPRGRIRIDRSVLDGGFGRSSDDAARACQRVEERTRLRLDPIFGGKAWLAMEHWRRAAPRNGRPVLYWHCGYTPEWETLTRRLR